MSAFISGYVAGEVNGFMHLLSQLLLHAALGLGHRLVCGDATRCQNFVASSLNINVPVCICLRVLKQSPVLDLLIMCLCGVLG